MAPPTAAARAAWVPLQDVAASKLGKVKGVWVAGRGQVSEVGKVDSAEILDSAERVDWVERVDSAERVEWVEVVDVNSAPLHRLHKTST